MEMGAVQLVSRGAPKAPPDKSKPVEDTSKPDWQRKYMAARSERKNQRKAAIRASRGAVLRQEALDRQQAGQEEECTDAKRAVKKKNKVHAAVTLTRFEGLKIDGMETACLYLSAFGARIWSGADTDTSTCKCK